MRTANPAFRTDAFSSASRAYFTRSRSETMTVDGAVNKTGILTLLLLVAAGYVWSLAFSSSSYDGVPALANPAALSPWMIGGAVGGLILALITSFKCEWAPYTAPAYSLCEGAFLGGISALMEFRYPGIVVQSALLTVGTLVTMLMAYKAGIIKATERFRSGMVMATGAIFFVYLISMILGWFGVNMSILHGSGPVGILVSLVVVVVAALNLILDFSMIEEGAQQNAPKYMEWYAGFALLVTLVWLYVEFLRLLAKINDRE